MSTMHDDYDNIPSKSQRKRDHHALVELGRQLSALPERARKKLGLPDAIHAAVDEAARMSPSGARERQFRYLGNLLEKADHTSIARDLEELTHPSREAIAFQHRIEAWRDRLLKEGAPALDALLAEQPQLDATRLRGLLNNAIQEAQKAQAPRSARALFRYLRDAMAEPAAEEEEDLSGDE